MISWQWVKVSIPLIFLFEKWYTLIVMKSLLRIIIVFFLVVFLAGCHTARVLTKINTGRVHCGDIWDSFVSDSLEFEERYW